MNIATAPSTPENAISPPVIRRAFTVPTKLAGFRQAAPTTPETDRQSTETLFAHNQCKIVSFNSGAKRPISAGKEQEEAKEPIGTLPWATTTERTIAAGPLRIYRVLEVAFLNSGTTLRPILAKSQCWCVDGESKFVLKIGYDSYYRIELPNTCAEEHEQVESFKKVLANVLQFERTPCPFKRAFTVELPHKSTPIVKKRPWRPRQQSQAHLERTPALKLEAVQGQDDTRRPISSGLDSDEIDDSASCGSDRMPEESETSEAPSLTKDEACEDGEEGRTNTGTGSSRPRDCGYGDRDFLSTPTRPKSLKTGRAITAPPQLTLKTTPPSDAETNVHEQTASLSSSMESFHSFHSPISPLPPSPSYSTPSSPTIHAHDDDTLDVHRTRGPKGESLDQILTNDSAISWVLTTAARTTDLPRGSSPPLPQTPTLISDTASQGEDSWSEAITPSPRTQLRHRRSSRRRTPSPLPPPANLYSPSARLSGHHLTTALLQKTCSLLLGPPVQLVALMLNIARKISNGSYCGFSFGTGESGQKIPCSWDFSDTEEEEIWAEDDLGISLGNVSSSKPTKSREIGGSWEID